MAGNTQINFSTAGAPQLKLVSGPNDLSDKNLWKHVAGKTNLSRREARYKIGGKTINKPYEQVFSGTTLVAESIPIEYRVTDVKLATIYKVYSNNGSYNIYDETGNKIGFAANSLTGELKKLLGQEVVNKINALKNASVFEVMMGSISVYGKDGKLLYRSHMEMEKSIRAPTAQEKAEFEQKLTEGLGEIGASRSSVNIDYITDSSAEEVYSYAFNVDEATGAISDGKIKVRYDSNVVSYDKQALAAMGIAYIHESRHAQTEPRFNALERGKLEAVHRRISDIMVRL